VNVHRDRKSAAQQAAEADGRGLQLCDQQCSARGV